ncbi:YigZ family protein [Ligilactobacillus salivarius]|uniref:YigZ family protein n=1 Tax=Ligilactobacillus salivarius TaxID=1624 RepID=UPI003B01149F
MKKPYLTIKENGEATIEIKKSEFICSLARTETEEEARAFIDEIKTKHRKATHNCFAYMIGLNDEIQRESDNGEPSGTAGVPILEVLKNLELHNVTAVVTRYFGGIKLGAGGLIRAYSNATSNAIEYVGVVRKVVQTELSLKVSYSAWGKLQNYLENNQVNVSDTVFMTDVTAVVYVDTPEVESFTATIVDLMNGQVEVEEGQEKYVEVPYELYK